MIATNITSTFDSFFQIDSRLSKPRCNVGFTKFEANSSDWSFYRQSDGLCLAKILQGLTLPPVTMLQAPAFAVELEPAIILANDNGTISQPGWRRLWTFSANTRNDGTKPIHIGDLTNPNNPWLLSNVFEFGNCDQEWDFNYYVDFAYNTATGVKRAFCI